LSGLFSAIKVGMRALQATELGQRVVGNNIANVDTAGYTRQRVDYVPSISDVTAFGTVGTGVDVAGVSRVRDAFIDAQMWAQLAEGGRWTAVAEMLSRAEMSFNEPGEWGISASLSEFFAAARTLAQPDQADNSGVRIAFMEAASSLALSVREVRASLVSIQDDASDELSGLASQISAIAEQVAALNEQITRTEAQYGSANELRDKRDALLEELAGIIDVRAAEGSDGIFRVTINGGVLVEGQRAEAVEFDDVSGELRWSDTGVPIEFVSGRIGGMLEARDDYIAGLIDELDAFAGTLIEQVNLIHASGLQLDWATSLTGGYQVTSATALLSDISSSGLPLAVSAGQLTVVANGPGGETETVISVASLETTASLAAKLDALAGISASVEDGRLVVTADSGYGFKIGLDTSGALSALGLGTLFLGEDAATVEVNSLLAESPGLLCTGRNGDPGDASVMNALAGLESSRVATGGYTLEEALEGLTSELGAATKHATDLAESRDSVISLLYERRESISGVSLDEEMTNMLLYQRAYVAAARFVSTVDEMLAVLVGELKR